MKSISEKEKKLIDTLDKLKNLENLKPDNLRELEILYNQKNQLQIEKKEIEGRYSLLKQENETLKQQFDDFKKKNYEEKKKKKINLLKKLMN